jgi:hypothetical protein
MGEHLLDGGQLMAFAGARDLGHDELRFVRIGRHQMRSWDPRRDASRRPAQRLAIDGQGLTWMHACQSQPLPQCVLECGDIQRLEEPMQRRHTRRPTGGQAERHEQFRRVLQPLAAPLGDGGQALCPTQQGRYADLQDRHQRKWGSSPPPTEGRSPVGH